MSTHRSAEQSTTRPKSLCIRSKAHSTPSLILAGVAAAGLKGPCHPHQNMHVSAHNVWFVYRATCIVCALKNIHNLLS